MRRWIILKARGGNSDPARPWQLWLANGLDRWLVAQRPSHAACTKHMAEVTGAYRAARQASKVEWPIDERTETVRLDVAGYAPDQATTTTETNPGGAS